MRKGITSFNATWKNCQECTSWSLEGVVWKRGNADPQRCIRKRLKLDVVKIKLSEDYIRTDQVGKVKV